MLRGCLRRDVVWCGSFTPDGTYDSVWDCVRPTTGRYTIYYFQHQWDVRCVCMLSDWICSNDEICADNFIYSRFKLKGKCRSEKWEVYLYGDKTIKVERAQVQFLDSGDMPVVVTTGHGVQTFRKLWFSTVAVHRQGVDVPVSMQRRCLALGGATDSVRVQFSTWTSQLRRDSGLSARGTCDEGGRSSSHW